MTKYTDTDRGWTNRDIRITDGTDQPSHCNIFINCKSLHDLIYIDQWPYTRGKRPSCKVPSVIVPAIVLLKHGHRASTHVWICTVKPQDSFGEFDKIFQKSSESAGNHQKNTIRPSCNCFEWHIVMQYCPSGGLRTFSCFYYFLKMEAFQSELLTGH